MRYNEDEIRSKISEYANKYENWDAQQLIEESFKRPSYYETKDFVDLLFFVREYLAKLDIASKEEVDRQVIPLFEEIFEEEQCSE